MAVANGYGSSRLVYGVGALVRAVADALAARFGVVAVRGEISGFNRAASGHCYFNLKDADGQIRCALFRRAASLLAFTPADGLQVELRGRVAVYEPRGELQFIVEAMTQAGAGSLYEQFLRLKAKLEAEGLFDPQRRRQVPARVWRVGIVTSLAAAALRDVLAALARRAPHVEVVIYPAAVQGAEAPPELAQAIERAGRRAECDVLLVCRGGGSLEDLWAFNDERVVRAIAASPLVVVCGVGHETDITLADFAADLRAPTPTAAAELAVAPRAALLEALAQQEQRLRRSVQRRLEQQAQRLDRLASSLARPADTLHQQARRLAWLGQRLHHQAAHAGQAHAHRLAALAQRWRAAPGLPLARQRARLERLEARLAALDPARVLRRGYSWVTDESGRVLTSVQQVRPGQLIAARWADGSARAEVRDIVPTIPSSPP